MKDEDKTKRQLIRELADLRKLVSTHGSGLGDPACGSPSPGGTTPGQAEAALQESEEKFRNLAERSLVGIYLIQDGMFAYVNPRMAEIFGYAVDDLIGARGPRDLTAPEDWPLVEENFRKRLGGEEKSIKYEFRGRTKKNEVIFLEVYGTAMRYQGRPAVIGSLLDVSDRVKNESALRESEKKYRMVIENAERGIMLTQDGKIRLANPKMQTLFGCREHELLTKPFTEFIHPRDRNLISDLLRKQQRGDLDPRRIETVRIIRNDGATRWLEVKSAWTTWEERPAALHFLNDITDRKRAEEALIETEAQLRTAIDSLPFDFWMCDSSGRYIMQNAVSIGLWGDVRGKSPEELGRAPETLALWLDNNRRAFAGEKVEGEASFSVDGEERTFYNIIAPVFDGKKIRGILGINIDITDRKQTEKTLREYRKAVECSLDLIAVVDRDYRYLIANQAFLRYHQLDTGTVVGHSAPDIVGRDIFEKTIKPKLDECFRGAVVRYEMKYTYPDIGERDMLVSYLPVEDAGSISRVAVVIHDITEHKRLEEEIRKSQKLESLGMLAGGIAHDFNNILAAIAGHLSLSRMKLNPGDPIRERLEHVEKAALRARMLTEQLLTFSRGGAPLKAPISLERAIRASAGFVLSGTNVTPVLCIDERLRAVEADEGQMGQAFNNLLINARQSMPDGGMVTISARNRTIADADGLPLPPGEYVQTTITDQGSGIAPEHISKIYDPYFTTKEKGSGLGLSITYSIIRNHGGHIQVESAADAGTTFTVYLPASSRRAASESDDDVPITGTGKVLFMDDEKMIRDFAGEMLRVMGYEVVVARDGAEAIALYEDARDSPRPFDAVIMDLTVPGGMGGKEAIEKLRAIDPGVKALVSSGYSNDPVMATFREYGFSDVIAKPYDAGELSRILHRLIAGA